LKRGTQLGNNEVNIRRNEFIARLQGQNDSLPPPRCHVTKRILYTGFNCGKAEIQPSITSRSKMSGTSLGGMRGKSRRLAQSERSSAPDLLNSQFPQSCTLRQPPRGSILSEGWRKKWRRHTLQCLRSGQRQFSGPFRTADSKPWQSAPDPQSKSVLICAIRGGCHGAVREPPLQLRAS
jgi:hypothetical protein